MYIDTCVGEIQLPDGMSKEDLLTALEQLTDWVEEYYEEDE